MSTQPEALRIAGALRGGTYLLSVERDATETELRRLYALNQELLEALQKLLTFPLGTFQVAAAKAVIAKATAPAVQRLPADDTEGGAA